MQLSNKHVVIIGGTSGIGAATAKLAVEKGAYVTITGLNKGSVDKARKELGNKVEVKQLDITNESALQKFFNELDQIDYITTPGSAVPKGGFLTMDSVTAKSGFESKFWGQYNAAKYATPKIRTGGAIVFFSGVISRRPQSNLAIMASVNSAVEGLGRALAVELAPIRVNVLAPGIVDTPRYASLAENDRIAMFDSLSKKLPVGHVGKPEELAEAVLFLMTNAFTTGATFYVDGGHILS
ncbi:MAG: SDR family oxidoreductase [Coxiellaceae bacterium]|nr:MAG: SDR family oxidoreductase [Coxiellaceae bacterium]